ncbi:MAG: alpha/beta hydrolase [Candidatus Alcyoniella australis]|nr:alpha/beta hydrolase [Candidatus Alcyoniella australis]
MLNKSKIEGIQKGSFESFDGTRIAYQSVGQGPPLVFANGLGGTFNAWCYLFNHLKARYRIVTWDYRGLYASERPRDLNTMTIPVMVRDMHCLIEHLKVERPIIAGWSMGVPIVIEYYKAHPEQVRGLGLICGSAGRPFDTALHWGGSRYLMPLVFNLLERLPGLTGKAMKLSLNLEPLFKLAQPLGIVAKEADIEVFKELVEDYSGLDFEAYFHVMNDMGKQDAWDFLSRIDAPTLIVAAGRDFFTPVYVSERMHRRIRGSELLVLPKGTHYAPLEFPSEINAGMDKFLDRMERTNPLPVKAAPKPKPKPKAKAKAAVKAKPKPALKKTVGKPKPKAAAKAVAKAKAKPKTAVKAKPKPKKRK